jgi:hypothetical protein
MLSEIIRRLETAEDDSSTIAVSEVRGWMTSDDVEVLGATCTLLMDARLVQRIRPSLPFDEVFAFFLRYYEFCLKQDPHGEWVDDRFSAACDIVSTFVSWWDDRRNKVYFDKIKSLLSHLYIEGTPELKRSIEQAIVEHLFERDDIRQFFSDWNEDPRLRPAYDSGVSWAKGGGTSPLTKRRQP